MKNLKRIPRVLLVEDRPQDVRLVRRAWVKLGFEQIPVPLDVVEDGAMAMDFLQKRSPWTDAVRPDLILLDWMLPYKNGIEVLQEIRQDPNLQKIPVIVFTTSPSDIDIEESHAAGANAYLRKPIDPVEFEETLRVLGLFWFNHAYLPKS